MKKSFVVLAAALLIVGCKLEMSSNINWSDIVSPTNKVVMSTLNVEVMTCEDDDVAGIQKEFEKRGIQARYNRCVEEGMENYAQFSMPVNMIKENTTPPAKISDVAFYVRGNMFYVQTSNRFKTLLASDSNDIASQELEINKIEFELTNDTEQPVAIQSFMAFIDNKPTMSDRIDIQPYDKIFMTLSDVANALLSDSNVSYPAFQILTQ